MRTWQIGALAVVVNGAVGHSIEFGRWGSLGIRYDGTPWLWFANRHARVFRILG